jgi:predicted MFS family arabinose efflux permease
MATILFFSLLTDYVALPPERVAGVLFTLSIAALIGDAVMGALSQRGVRVSRAGVGLVCVAATLLLLVSAIAPVAASALVLVWGLVCGGVPVSLQTWILLSARHLKEGRGAVFTSLLQLVLAVGSLVGGAILNTLGLHISIMLGLTAILAMLGTVVFFGRSFALR